MDKKQALAREAEFRARLKASGADKPDYSAHPETFTKDGAFVEKFPNRGGVFQRDEKTGAITHELLDEVHGSGPNAKRVMRAVSLDEHGNVPAPKAAETPKPTPAVNVPGDTVATPQPPPASATTASLKP